MDKNEIYKITVFNTIIHIVQIRFTTTTSIQTFGRFRQLLTGQQVITALAWLRHKELRRTLGPSGHTRNRRSISITGTNRSIQVLYLCAPKVIEALPSTIIVLQTSGPEGRLESKKPFD